MLAESKEKGGGKLYSGRDVKMIARIRELLYDEGFTVAGAKKRLESEISEGRFDEGFAPAPSPSQQKKLGKGAPAEAPLFAPESRPLARSSPPAAATRAAAPPPTEFPERKRVLKELKEIARLLQRPSAR
jgi:DNA-binding transcriptional MerR regulator